MMGIGAEYDRLALSRPCALRSGIASCASADVAAAPRNANVKARYLIASSRADAIAHRVGLAGGLGFEPRLTESESAVLPLNYPPIGKTLSMSVVPGRVLSPRSLSLGRRGARTSTRRQHI